MRVLGKQAGDDGWLMDTRPALTWVSRRGVRLLPRLEGNLGATGTELGQGLVTLFHRKDETVVVELTEKGAHERLTFPATLEGHLAVDDRGEVALVVLPDTPSTPHLLPLDRPGSAAWIRGEPVPLPSFGVAKLADDAACGTQTGYRAIVPIPLATTIDWYTGAQPDAVVRFTAARPCIEAVDDFPQFMRWFSGQGDGVGGAMLRFVPPRRERAYLHVWDVTNNRDFGGSSHALSCELN